MYICNAIYTDSITKKLTKNIALYDWRMKAIYFLIFVIISRKTQIKYPCQALNTQNIHTQIGSL